MGDGVEWGTKSTGPLSSTISDLAYCEDLRVLVTASWDSTVKVWDSDWQIQMVFLGHTGMPGALPSALRHSWLCRTP